MIAGLTQAAPIHAQACDDDCVTIIEAALDWAAARLRVPLTEITVDTSRAGFVRSGADQPFDRFDRPEVYGRLHSTRGVILATTDEVFDCTRPAPLRICALARPALVSVSTVTMEGFSASLVIELRKLLPDGSDSYGMFELRFTREGARWKLQSAGQIGWS